MTQHHLTKSDFKLGYVCPFKLKYKKLGYPNTLKDNAALEFFAEGGFMVEAIVHAVMKVNPHAVFEKTLTSGRFFARVDGFEQFKDRVVLTEIKAKSVKSGDASQFFSKKSSEVVSDWLPYMLDITFQVMVAELCFPGVPVEARLCLVNQNKSCSVDAIYSNIDLFEDAEDRDRSLPRAVYTGDIDALRADNFLEFIDVRECVDQLMPLVKAKAAELLDFLDGNRQDIMPQLGLSLCKTCEYRDADAVRDGFAECWGETPARGDNLIDLYRAGNGSAELKEAIAVRIERRELQLIDLPDSYLANGKSYGPPRRNQVDSLRSGKEVIDIELAKKLGEMTYPLHFIDFEASRIPVPYLSGMKPYEIAAFQFSCHTLKTPAATELVHHEWLNLNDVYPNDEFVHELKKAIGNDGTVLIWSGYELTTLRHIRRQLRERGQFTTEIAQWMEGLVGIEPAIGEEDKSKGKRIVDLLNLSQAYYAHPSMKGGHGIKRVLDSIWSDAEHLWSDPWFSLYYKTGSDGKPIDPYQTLVSGGSAIERALAETDDSVEGAVTDGVGAMRAYQDMLYGQNRSDLALRDRMRDSLYRYCGLDTAAMVMIWKHWLTLSSSKET